MSLQGTTTTVLVYDIPATITDPEAALEWLMANKNIVAPVDKSFAPALRKAMAAQTPSLPVHGSTLTVHTIPAVQPTPKPNANPEPVPAAAEPAVPVGGPA